MSKYLKGESGNKNGRPKGTLDRRTRLLQELEDDLPALVSKLKENALGGDTTALKFLLDRVLPIRKSSAELITLPELVSSKSFSEKVDVILGAVANMQLPPDIGSQLINAIGTASKIAEVSELQDRMTALEGLMQ